MNHPSLKQLIYDYFNLNHCSIHTEGEKTTVHLTKEMDQLLMNRPFYWHYQDMMKQEGIPLQLDLSFSPLNRTNNNSLIQLGSDLFMKIYADAIEKGRFTNLYQIIQTDKQTALYPWLIITVKITYKGDYHEENMHSLAINLIKGTIIDHAFNHFSNDEWSNQISDYCYVLTPLIRIENGYQRIMKCLTEQLSYKKHIWARYAYENQQKHLAYFDSMDKNDETELENIKANYQPSIIYKIVNCGIFHCS
ncbi:YqhG family protein [Pelagirhabdus alkalitolerans]|nr:YqhG family protein [Pelagirhabdus alkalitolerans]